MQPSNKSSAGQMTASNVSIAASMQLIVAVVMAVSLTFMLTFEIWLSPSKGGPSAAKYRTLCQTERVQRISAISKSVFDPYRPLNYNLVTRADKTLCMSTILKK